MGWYITILQEMREELGLKGNELIVFAFINGYSQEGQGCYFGSLANLQEVCGIASRQTAIDTLKSLVAKGYIERKESNNGGVKKVYYSVCIKSMKAVQKLDKGVQKLDKGVQKLDKGVQKMDRVCPKNGHINKKDIDVNISSLNREDNSPKAFNFKKALIEIGVSDEVASAWMDVRKRKRATNSEIAFAAVRREITKSGMAPDDAIRLAVEKSWSGFDSSWLEKEKKVAPKRESVFEHNIKVMDKMFGTDNHSRLYGTRNNDIDEQ